MVTKFKLFLLCTVFVVHNAQLNGSAAASAKTNRKSITISGAKAAPNAATAAATLAGDANADDAADASAADSKAAAETGKSGSPVAVTVAAGSKAPAAPTAAVTVSAAPAPAPQASASPAAASKAAPAATLVAAATAVSGSIDGSKAAAAASDKKGAAEEMTLPNDPKAVAEQSSFTRSFWSSIKHKAFVYKPADLLYKLKALNADQSLAPKGDVHCAKFITDAAIEITTDLAEPSKEQDSVTTILETLTLLKQKAASNELVNETARRTYRKALRNQKNKHIKIAEENYDADITAAQAAFKKAIEEATGKYKGTCDKARLCHNGIMLTHDVGGDSDIEETQETYAEEASLAGVKPENLRGVAQGKLIIPAPLRVQRKIKIATGTAAAPATGTDAGK